MLLHAMVQPAMLLPAIGWMKMYGTGWKLCRVVGGGE